MKRDWISRRRIKCMGQRAAIGEWREPPAETIAMEEGRYINFTPSDATPEQIDRYRAELDEANRAIFASMRADCERLCRPTL